MQTDIVRRPIRHDAVLVAASDSPPSIKAGADFVCDGVGDHIELQAALDLAPRPIRLGPGTYRPDQIALVGSGTVWEGAGREVTTIRVPNAYQPTAGPHGGSNMVARKATGQSEIAIRGITFDHNEANITTYAAGASEAASHTIDLRDVTGLTIEDVAILNSVKWAILSYDSSNIDIHRTKIRRGAAIKDQGDGIHLTNPFNFRITQNDIDLDSAGLANGKGDDCIVVRSIGGTSTDGLIQSNVLRGGQRAVALVSEGADVRYVNVLGNNVWSAYSSAFILNFYTHATPGIFVGCRIDHNIMRNVCSSGTGHGILIQHPVASGTGVHSDGFRALSVSGNTMYGMLNTGGIGICVEQGKLLQLNDNELYDIRGSRGIALMDGQNPVIGYSMNDNVVDVSAGASGVMGMLVCAQDGTISGNTLLGQKTTGTTYGVWMRSSATAQNLGNVVTDNRVQNFVTSITESNAGTAPNYNLYTGNNSYGCTNGISKLGANSVIVTGGNL